jgi:hypothetical protein
MTFLLYFAVTFFAGFVSGSWFLLRLTRELSAERTRLSDAPVTREMGR